MFEDTENETVCKKILNQIGKTKEDIGQDVTYLRTWLMKQPHLPHSADDIMLRAFIVGTSSMEQAKKKLDNFYSYKNKYELFHGLDPTLVQYERAVEMAFLPGFTNDGYKILFVKCPKEYAKLQFRELTKEYLLLFLKTLFENSVNSGQILLIDMREYCLQHSLKLSIIDTSQLLSIYQNVTPIKIKGIIWFNCPDLVNALVNTCILPFISEKLRKRVVLYSGGVEELRDLIPLAMLPEDYGGKAPPLKTLYEQEKESLKKMRDWFLTEGSYRSDESKRPPPSTDEFGVQGTFRKLNVD